MNQINSYSNQTYIINKDNIYNYFSQATLINNVILGYITVNSYGNIVPYGLSFEEEDKYTYENRFNILEMSFKDAIKNYVNLYNKPKEKKLTKSLK